MHIDLKKDKESIFLSLEKIEEAVKNAEKFYIKNMKSDNTLIVLVDVINGFIGEGVYSNPLAPNIMNTVSQLVDNKEGIQVIALSDAHTEDSFEFDAHPIHALGSTSEAELHKALKKFDIRVFKKDSINGFFAEGFKEYFDSNHHIDNVVVVGLVTDICVLNFCMTLKTYCNQMRRQLAIHVPITGIESFDIEGIHSATLMNLVSASMMMTNGIKLYSGLK